MMRGFYLHHALEFQISAFQKASVFVQYPSPKMLANVSCLKGNSWMKKTQVCQDANGKGFFRNPLRLS